MSQAFHPDSLPDLTGRVYVVTGGNAGIGYHTVFHLAKHNAKVYLGSRNAKKGNTAIDEIKAKVPHANIELLLMDLMNMKSVITAAKEVLSKETKLHGLINSAGIMAVPFEMTADGYESQIQTNYLSHFMLTYHLLPLLQKTAAISPKGTVRIVNVSSIGHKAAPSDGINFEDINLREAFTFRRYSQSKLANILHAKALNKRYGPKATPGPEEGEIWVSSLHPGNVDTQLNTKSWGSSFLPLLRCFGVYIKPEEGSFTSLFAAASPEFKQEDSGMYFVPFGKRTQPSKKATDANLAEKLWDWTKAEMEKKGFIE